MPRHLVADDPISLLQGYIPMQGTAPDVSVSTFWVDTSASPPKLMGWNSVEEIWVESAGAGGSSGGSAIEHYGYVAGDPATQDHPSNATSNNSYSGMTCTLRTASGGPIHVTRIDWVANVADTYELLIGGVSQGTRIASAAGETLSWSGLDVLIEPSMSVSFQGTAARTMRYHLTDGPLIVGGLEFGVWQEVGSHSVPMYVEYTPYSLQLIPAATGGGGGLVGSYNIEGAGIASHVDAGLGDEFETTTLDPSWTIVGGGATAGTVQLGADPTGHVYDLVTRPGCLLLQADTSTTIAEFRKTGIPADGEQVIASLLVAEGWSSSNNYHRVAFGLNTGAGYDAGTYCYLYYDGADRSAVALWDGGLIGQLSEAAFAAGRIYFRIINVAGTFVFYASRDGTTWAVLGRKTFTPTHLSIAMGSPVTHASADAPIHGVEWVRHVANHDLDPW